MVKIITIIKNGKRFDFPKDKLVTDLNELKKYGTSEGAKAGWDARGRGNKEGEEKGSDKESKTGDTPWASIPKTHQDAIIAIATDGHLSREMKEGGIKAIMDSIPKNKKPKKKG